MPLRGHFHPPVNRRRSWEGFHGQWPAMIVMALARRLPPGYVAEPRVHLGAYYEVDIGSFEDHIPADSVLAASAAAGGAATAAWAPPQPTFVVATDIPDQYEYEVRVYDDTDDRRLVAAVEIVSPANKDRPEHRRMFVAKCASLLGQGVCVAVVDLVTTRHFNLYSDLLEFFGQSDPSLAPEPPPLYAAVCRWRRFGETPLLESWLQTLVVGEPLPTAALWLADDLAVPLELEASYEETCRILRIA